MNAQEALGKYYLDAWNGQLGQWTDLGIGNGGDPDVVATNALNYAMHMADLDYNYAMQMEQNEYNSPKNQLARYLEAGLNPSMVYGQVSPGLQTSPLTSKSPQMESGAQYKYQKQALDQQMFASATNIVGQFLNLASKVEGIKGQALQNDVVRANLPVIQATADWNNLMIRAKEQIYHDSGEFNLKHISDYGDMSYLVFPEYYQSWQKDINAGLARERERYQRLWNDEIFPMYKKTMEGKEVQAQATGEIQEYQKEMLEALPSAVRPWVSMLLQILGAGVNVYSATKR